MGRVQSAKHNILIFWGKFKVRVVDGEVESYEIETSHPVVEAELRRIIPSILKTCEKIQP